jgi:hypothetical protein
MIFSMLKLPLKDKKIIAVFQLNENKNNIAHEQDKLKKNTTFVNYL